VRSPSSFSVALSVKMNIVLMAPAIGAIVVVSEGWRRGAMHALNVLLVQVGVEVLTTVGRRPWRRPSSTPTRGHI